MMLAYISVIDVDRRRGYQRKGTGGVTHLTCKQQRRTFIHL